MEGFSLSVFGDTLIVPIVIIFVGSAGKKLARGRGWERQDFFFGIELSLAAMSGALTILLDNTIQPSIVQKSGFFITICFGLFIYVLALYQEHGQATARQQYIWLTFFSNMIGVVLMMIFVFWFKTL
ncbi:MAG: hypothetical protein F6K31_02600 [Symploca sp. SIO2G7]|nr:hypothetical protein [Symploca sp. SIO2G7]